jgi:glycosyltransferase involved in cell wall biosynthesis
MRLTFVIYSLEAGGAQRVAGLLLNAWVDRGHDVTVLTFAGTPFYPIDSRVRQRHLSGMAGTAGLVGKTLNNLRRIRQLRLELQRSAPDCIVSFIDQLNVVTALAAIGLRRRLVISERVDPAMAPINATWKFLRDECYRLTDAIVMQTQGAVASLPPFARSRAVVIPNPVRAPDRRSVERRPCPRKIIVGIGRLVPQKGFDLLLEACSRVFRDVSDWDLIILGEGPDRQSLENSLANLGLAGRVSLPGIAPDVDAYLSRADLFVLSSRFEGFPNALCEAMSWGLPVIATDCRSGPSEIVQDDVDGVLVAPDSVDALESAMRRLIGDEQLRERLGAAASRISSRFGLPTIVDEWLSVLGSTENGR